MVRSDRHVSGARLNHASDGREHAAHGGNFPAVFVPCRRKSVVMAEQFVRTVDEMDFQWGDSTITLP